MRRILGLAAIICWIAFQPSEAAQLKHFKVGAWDSGAYSDGPQGKFSHCAGSASYNSGVIVTLLINREYKWGVAFSHPAWNLTPGTDINLAYVVDGGEPRATTAKVVSNKQALIGFGGDSDRFKEFSRGYFLRIAAANQVFTFNLTDTAKLLPALLNCVTQQLNPAPVLASTATRTAAPVGQRGDFRAEATVITANLLSQAGITGFRIATAQEFPELKADAIWAASNVIGTINILPTATAKDLDELRSAVIGNDAKACKGMFFSGSIPDDGKEQLIRVFSTCQVKDVSATNYYLAVPRKAGGIYILRTMTASGSEKPAKEADASIRKAVFTALPK
ncbi:hypothetical protein [Bradyrhizobium canariense]|uniref:Uncharacterized protein n=1 Tax=Bradyrhizobium canariense TaxID=255045 RepID=A0A1H1XV57_9BRAD|nr:hypothetical protein [Bradyrhizobium canariense]SDT13160.1 hypothetical protein SAMN05444158_4506 [Bradyrhizobium canariense]